MATLRKLHIENVYKQYGEKVILDDIDLSVSEGELCTVVGPSGCGKSTLLRLILGQEQVTRGSITINGKPVGEPDTARGIVYQRYSLFPNMTVLENVTLGLKLKRSVMENLFNPGDFDEEAMEYLKRVKLDIHAKKYPHELSGGMQQRAAIAQALIMKHDILLMDEPFGALDPQTREDMQIFLLELWEQEKMTVFFVTHDLEEAVFLGTRCLVLSQYYSDDRSAQQQHKRGAKLVADYGLTKNALSSKIKENEKFMQLIEDIRQEGFDPDYLQHVSEFNLTHEDSFQTIEKHDVG